MNKKHKAVLLGTMITLALQTGSAYAKTYDEDKYNSLYDAQSKAWNYYDIKSDEYNDYVEFGTGSDSDKANSENKEKASIHLGVSDLGGTFTFKNGATIDSSERSNTGDYAYFKCYDKAAIANFSKSDSSSPNKLIVNIGNENGNQKSQFQLNTKSKLGQDGYGISVGNTSDSEINIKNTDFYITTSAKVDSYGKPMRFHNGILAADNSNLTINIEDSTFNIEGNYHVGIGTENDSVVNINAENTDFNFSSEESRYVISTDYNSQLEIDGNKTTNIKISSDYMPGSGLYASENSSLKIKDIKNINIDGKIDGINAEKNSIIEISADYFSVEGEKDAPNKGIFVYDGSEVSLDITGDVNINNVCYGIETLRAGISSDPLEKKTVSIKADNIKINAIDYMDYGTTDFGTGVGTAVLLASNSVLRPREVILDSNQNISLIGEVNGLWIAANTSLNLDADKSIEIKGENGYGITTGIHGDYISSMSINNKVDINAEDAINIYGKKAGILFSADGSTAQSNGSSVDLKSENNSIIIESDDVGIDSDNNVHNDMDLTLTAKSNIEIKGDNNGIRLYYMDGKSNITSETGNIFVMGNETSIIIDSQNKEKTYSNRYKEELSLKTEGIEYNDLTGNIYIGGTNDENTKIDNKNGISNKKGISNVGRNIVNIDANKVLQIEGNEVALEVKKQTDNGIKGKYINIYSDENGISTEGVNSLQIGYSEEDGKNTEKITIYGDIGIEQIANTLGEKDNKSYNNEDAIWGENNETIINANNIDIIGNDYGLKIVQEAMAQKLSRENNNDDSYYTMWKNNIVDIEAKDNLNIRADEGTAIDVDGVNKVDISNKKNNNIIGKLNGINLNLNEKIPNILPAKEYKSNKVEEMLQENSGCDDEQWNGSYSEIMKKNVESQFNVEDLETFYKKLFTDPEYTQNPAISEITSKLDPNGDPLKEILKGFFGYSEETIESLYVPTREYYLNNLIYNRGYTLEEYYDKLVDDGKFKQINSNIDTENSFNLITEDDGINTVVGGEKALNADGQVNAVISGGSNVISNYVATPLDEDKEVEPTYAVKAQKEANVDITATNGSNIIQSTGTGIYATDENTIVNIKNETKNKEKITQDEANQIVSGEDVAINADNKATVNLTGENAKNYISGTNSGVISDNQAKVIVEGSSIDIYSSEGTGILAQQTTNINTLDSQENESTTIDLRATDINITGGKYGVKASENSIINIKSEKENGSIKVTSWNKEDTKENETASIYAESTENEDAEINIEAEKGSINLQSYNKTVWASGNGGEINIKGGNVNIGAYSIERDGEGQHIAIVAGTNDEETNEKIGKVNVEIVGSKDNNITGDIIGGRSGEVKVENRGKGTLAVTGDILAGNGGAVDISFGNNSFYSF